MKTYTTPNTETIETLQCFAICDPSAGTKQQENPVVSGDPNAAPGRKVF